MIDKENYEESNDFWMINILGVVEHTHGLPKNEVEMMKEIGNHFETKEEAEQARNKLKALQRLRDNDTEILGWETEGSPSPLGRWQVLKVMLNIRVDKKEPMELLDLLLGGEE